tara:strand:+ start:217 stop:429 length:213 start_codon:yes stop_codon:yes gene_type:complete
MKKIINLGLAIGVATILLSSCNNNSQAKSPAESKMESIVKTQCPMKCEGEITYQEKGTCPVCKMDLQEIK